MGSGRKSIPFEIQRQRWRLSPMTMPVALLRRGLFLKTFGPNQPRVSATAGGRRKAKVFKAFR